MKEYKGDDIKTISGLEHMRHRAQMYGFNKNSSLGLAHMVKEVKDNCVDECQAVPDKDQLIVIKFLKKSDNFQCIITDQGRGIPLSKVVDAFSKYGTSGKWGNAYAFSAGTHGVGSKGVAALSANFVGVSQRSEGSSSVTMIEGVVAADSIVKKTAKDVNDYGTAVLFEPDLTRMGHADTFFDDGGYQYVQEMCEYISAIQPNAHFEIYIEENARINPKNLRNNNAFVLYGMLKEPRGKLVYKSPLDLTPVEYLRSSAKLGNITWQSELFEKEVDVFNENDLFGYHVELFTTVLLGKRKVGILSTVNSTRISDKTAVQIRGTFDVLKDFLSIVMTMDEERRSFFKSVYELPINVVVLAKFRQAEFMDQKKSNFTDLNFYNLFTKHFKASLKRKDAEYWEQLVDLIKDDFETKYARYTNKDMMVNAGLKNLQYKLRNEGIYVPCESKDSELNELFMTEGTSAGDLVKNARNTVTQAVFKYKGKPMNPFKKGDALDDYSIYLDMRDVIGVSKIDTDLSNMNFKRIGILTDADADGYHFATLILSLLWKINPLIITEGRVFISSPPLYEMMVKDCIGLPRDLNALMDTKIQVYEKNIDLILHTKSSGVKFQLKQANYREACYFILHIGGILENIAKKLATDMLNLEQMVHCIDMIDRKVVDTAGIKKLLSLDRCECRDDVLLISSGDADVNIPLTGLVDEIRKYILPEINKVQWDDFEFIVSTADGLTTDQPMSLSEIYKLFQGVDEVFSINKFKGVGELEPDQVAETCLDPTTRAFVRVAGPRNVDNIYRLMGVNTKYRKALLSDELIEK